MSSDSFSEIFRPKNPKQLIGESQKKVAQSLLDNVAKGKVIQEVLFSGDSGIGKTTIARMYIDAVIGETYVFNPFNCGDKTGVNYIREEVIGTMSYLPLDLKYRVYFLDEIHMLSPEAQNSLLVAIEPVPEHVLLIACTTQPGKLIPTLRSRFTEYKLSPPSMGEFQTLSKWICKKEAKTLDDKTRDQVITLAGGNVRQFVRYFQQALDGSFNGDEAEKQPEIELVKLILNQPPNFSKWLNAIDESSDFVRQAIGMVSYSLAVLKNGKVSKPAMAILRHFGNSPSRNIDSKSTFCYKLLEVYEEIIRA